MSLEMELSSSAAGLKKKKKKRKPGGDVVPRTPACIDGKLFFLLGLNAWIG